MLKTPQGKGLYSQVLKNTFNQIGRASTRFETPQFVVAQLAKSNKDSEVLEGFSVKKSFVDLKQWEMQWKNQSFSNKNTAKLERLPSLKMPSNLSGNQLPLTALQSVVLPKLTNPNLDAIVESEPLSGKTTTHALAVLLKTLREKSESEATGKSHLALNTKQHVDVRHPLSVRSLILASSNQSVAHIESIFSELAKGSELNIIGLSEQTEQDNYNKLCGPQKNIDILIATPAMARDAIKKGWISTVKVNTLVIDDSNTLVQSSKDNHKTLVQVLRSLPSSKSRQTLVFGDYISDDMVEALRPYLKTFNQDILLFKGENSYFEHVDFQFVETKSGDNLAQLESTLSTLSGNSIIFAKNPEQIVSALSASSKKVVNLAVPKSELAAQLTKNPDLLSEADVFVTNEDYGVASLVPTTVTNLIHFNMESVGDVISRTASILLPQSGKSKSIIFYDASVDTGVVGSFAPFLQMIKSKVPSFVSSNFKNNELNLLKSAEEAGSRELLSDVLFNNYKLESMYAKNYGAEELQSLRASTQGKQVPTAEPWEWRNTNLYLKTQQLSQKDHLFSVMESARAYNEKRREYRQERSQKMKQSYMEKKKKRKERAEKGDEDE